MANKASKRIHVNGIFGAEIEEIQAMIEDLGKQKAILDALYRQAVRLAGKDQAVPATWKFDPATMEFFEPPEETEDEVKS